MKCPNCKKEILTDGTIHEYLIDVRNDLIHQKEMLIERNRRLKNETYIKNNNLEVMKINNRLSDVNEQIKQHRMAVDRSMANYDSIFIKVLLLELKSIGYSKEMRDELALKAKTEYEFFHKEAKEKLQILNNEILKNKHNEWHTESGVYDSTARNALKKTK